MNKNWLYRLLALALVAMLAIPMFALAEEEAFDLSAAEGVVVEEKAQTVDAVPVKVTDDEMHVEIDMDTSFNYDLEVDLSECSDGIFLVDTDGEKIDDWKKVKSDKTSVATITKKGKITVKKAGKAKLTLTGENSDDEEEKKIINLTVTDYYKVEKVKVEIVDGGEKITRDKNFTATYGQGMFNGDEAGEYVITLNTWAEDGDDDKVDDDHGGKVEVTSSNKNIAKVEKLAWNKYQVTVKTGKTGTAKLTIASKQKNSKKKIVMTVKVAENKSKTTTKTQINNWNKIAKQEKVVIFGVQKIKYAGVKKSKNGDKNKWDVSLYVLNGLDHKIEKISSMTIDFDVENKVDDALSIAGWATHEVDDKKTVNWKKGINYYKFTLETESDVDVPDFTQAANKLIVTDATFEEYSKDPVTVVAKGVEE